MHTSVDSKHGGPKQLSPTLKATRISPTIVATRTEPRESVSLSLSFSWGLATLHNASRNAVKGKDETSVTWNARSTHVSPCRRLSLPLSSTSAPSLPLVSTLPCSNSRIICFLHPSRRTCQQNVAREVLIVSDGD